MGFVVLHGANKPASSVAHDESTYSARTDIGIIFTALCSFLTPMLFCHPIPAISSSTLTYNAFGGEMSLATSVRAFLSGGKRYENCYDVSHVEERYNRDSHSPIIHAFEATEHDEGQ